MEQLENQSIEEFDKAFDVERNANRLTSDMATAMTRAQGMFEFMAPEMLNMCNYSKSIDKLSFGVVLIELLALEAPCPHNTGAYPFGLAKLVSKKPLRPRKLRRADLPHPGLLNVVEA